MVNIFTFGAFRGGKCKKKAYYDSKKYTKFLIFQEI